MNPSGGGARSRAADAGPFVKVFKTGSHRYVYDVSRNALFQTRAATAAVIEALGQGVSPAEVHARLRPRYSRDQVARSLRDVRRWKRKGYLSGRRPLGLRLGLTPSDLQAQMASGLRQLILGVTETCNLRCRYCVYSGSYRHFRQHHAASMTFEIAKKALDFFYDHVAPGEPNRISFYGGEPLVNLALIRECVAYYDEKAQGRRIVYNLTTNATLLKAEARRFLAEHNVAVRVSLDGPEEIHDTNRVYRNGRGSYGAVREHLEALAREYPAYFRERVSFCSVAGAPYKLAPVLEFFEGDPLFAGLTVSVNGVRPVDTSYLEEHPPSFDGAEIGALRRRYIAKTVKGEDPGTYLRSLFESRLADIVQRGAGKPIPEYLHPNKICIPGVRRLFVDSSGRFQACERFNETLFIGDVERGFDATKVAGLIDDYIRISEADCRTCWAVRLCRTCFISANGDGIDGEHKRKHCANERRELEAALSLYCTLMERNPDCLDRLKDLVFT